MYPKDLLRLALDNAYTVFADYPRPRVLEASPFKDADRIEALLAEPLRSLNIETLGYYASSAMTTVGEVVDYKYFLPRILELAVASALIEPEMIAAKLLYGHWREWPRPEVDAVASVFQAAFTEAIGEHPDDYRAEPWFLASVRLKLDMESLMRIWEAGPLANAMLQLTTLLDQSSLFGRRLGYVWSEAGDEVVRAVRGWLLSPMISDRLILAATVATDRDIWMLDNALNMQDILAGQFQ